MQKNEIHAALESLKKIKMPKIEDKSLRNDLIKDHYAIYDAGLKFDKAIEREKDVLLGAHKDDEQQISDLQREMQAALPGEEQREIAKKLLGFKAYEAAVRNFNEKAKELGKEEIKGLVKIDREKFMAEIEKQDFDLAMIEGLYPLFELEEEKKEK
jgi:hypothetical protein